MLLSNLEIVPGRKIVQHLGLVQGSTVRAKHIGRDIMASFKNVFGGELKGYTELLQEAREEATQRMIEQARAVGANAVLNVRFSTSSVAQGAAELFVYGSAVVLE
ncbi:MAG: YbjQ family protein [Candidatus Competibacteraceae bacterium]